MPYPTPLSGNALESRGEQDQLLRPSLVIVARRHLVTLRSSAGGLLAGGNETLSEQRAGKSSESSRAVVAGQRRRVRVCVCARQPACRAGCGSLPVPLHAAAARSAEPQASSHASRHCNLHFFGQKQGTGCLRWGWIASGRGGWCCSPPEDAEPGQDCRRARPALCRGTGTEAFTACHFKAAQHLIF